MNLLKEIFQKKYEDYFIQMKNNQFSPNLFFEAVSLANSYTDKLDSKQIAIRNNLLHIWNYDLILDCLDVDMSQVKNKTEFNHVSKSFFSVKAMPIVEQINECMIEDQNLINDFLKRFKETNIRRVEKIFDDIKLNWAVGVLKENV